MHHVFRHSLTKGNILVTLISACFSARRLIPRKGTAVLKERMCS